MMPKKKVTKKKSAKKEGLKNVLDLRNKEEKKDAPKEKPKKKSFPWKIITLSLIGVFVIVNGVFAYGIYAQGWNNQPTRIFTKVMPYPAAQVGWGTVGVDDYYKDLYSYQNYYQVAQKVDFEKEESNEIFTGLKEDLLTLLIEEEIVKKEAKKLDIKVEKSEVDEEYNRLAEEQGEETLKKEIEDFYQWDVKTFKKKIEAALIRQKLEEKVTTDDELSKDEKAKAEEILTKAKAGDDFTELAKEFSEDPSASDGGSLGWFGKGAMVPEFEEVAFSLEKGAISDIVKTQFGYHIIKVEDKKEDEVLASHILIKGIDFTEWLENKKSEYTIRKLLNLDKIKPFKIEIDPEVLNQTQ